MKRFLIILIFGMLFLVVFMSSFCALNSWPVHQQDIQHTGRSHYNLSSDVASQKMIYNLTLVNSSCQNSIIGPVIGTGNIIYFGLNQNCGYVNKTYAYYSNGSLKWESENLEGQPNHIALASDGSLYVSTSNKGLYALNSNGNVKWRYNPNGGFSEVTIGNNNLIYFSDYTRIYCLYSNGTQKWNNTGVSRGGSAYYGPAIGLDGNVYVVWTGFRNMQDEQRGYLIAYNSQNGSSKWGSALEFSAGAPSVGNDGSIYVIVGWSGYSSQSLYSFYPNGSLRWIRGLSSSGFDSPVISSDGNIIVGEKWSVVAGSSWGSYVYEPYSKTTVFNPQGDILWTTGTPNSSSIDQQQVIDSNGILVSKESKYKRVQFGPFMGWGFVAVNTTLYGRDVNNNLNAEWIIPPNITSSSFITIGNGNIYFLSVENEPGNSQFKRIKLYVFGSSQADIPECARNSDCESGFCINGNCIYPDLKVLDIKPIQVIEDIPLIKDKATMVRVIVDLLPSDIEEIDDVQIELNFGNNTFYETANLIRYNNKLYAVPDEHLANFKKYKSQNNGNMIKNLLFNYGLDAFNFDYPNNPLHPSITGNFTIIAKVDSDNRIDENDESNNEKTMSFIVKAFPQESYKVNFQRWSYNGNISDFSKLNNDIDFEKFTKSHFDYFIGTYPIPESYGKYLASISIMSGKSTYATLLGACSVFKKDFDKVVFVVPNIIFGWQGLEVILIKNCVFVDEESVQQITAHEIGHTYGYEDDWKKLSGSYPYGSLAGDGWDVRGVYSLKEDTRAKISINRDYVNDSIYNYYSFMSDTAGMSWATSNDYAFNKYNNLLQKIIGNTDPRVLVVSGIIYENNSVDLLPFYSFDGYSDSLEEGNYSFKCISSSGEILSNVSFEANFILDNETGQNVSLFVFSIFYPENTSKVILEYKNITLKEVFVSSSLPLIYDISLNNLGNEIYEIRWNMSDEDDDNLVYSIFYSHNNQDWIPLVFNSKNTDYFYELNASNLPGSNDSLLKIRVTDGINTAEAVSDGFSVSNKKPSAFISSPLNNSYFISEEKIIFQGWGYDPEESELNDSSLIWTSNLDGEIGKGRFLFVSNLSIGNHIITLRVNDKNNLSDEKEVMINIGTSKQINLIQGWNLVSFQLNPFNNSVENVFSSVMGKIIVINSFDNGAKTYDPLLPDFSDLQNIDYLHGYWVKMNESANLSFFGTIPQNKTINLIQGWNLIGYPCNNNKNISEILASINDKVIVVNGFENGALTYDPLLPEFSDLLLLKPNYGYWVKMNQSAVLDYGGIC